MGLKKKNKQDNKGEIIIERSDSQIFSGSVKISEEKEDISQSEGENNKNTIISIKEENLNITKRCKEEKGEINEKSNIKMAENSKDIQKISELKTLDNKLETVHTRNAYNDDPKYAETENITTKEEKSIFELQPLNQSNNSKLSDKGKEEDINQKPYSNKEELLKIMKVDVDGLSLPSSRINNSEEKLANSSVN